jgi:hypothetical protein
MAAHCQSKKKHAAVAVTSKDEQTKLCTRKWPVMEKRAVHLYIYVTKRRGHSTQSCTQAHEVYQNVKLCTVLTLFLELLLCIFTNRPNLYSLVNLSFWHINFGKASRKLRPTIGSHFNTNIRVLLKSSFQNICLKILRCN